MHKHVVIPIVFLLLGSVLVGLLGVSSGRIDSERIALETDVTAAQVQIRLESCVDTRKKLVDALANTPWTSRQDLLDRWASQAGNYYPLAGGIQALNYIDRNWVIRSVFPAESNQAALNANLRGHPEVSVTAAIGTAETANQMTRSSIIELLQSGKGFALYQPISSGSGQLLGFVNGVFRTTDLLASCLSEQRLRDRFVVSLFDGEQLFYQQPAAASGRHHLVNRTIDVVGMPWRLEISPLQDYVEASSGKLDRGWVALGMLFSILLALAVRSSLLKQRDLRDSEDKYRLLVENQTDMLVKVNPQGEFLYISPSYCEAFGKTEAELLGRHFMPLVHEADQEHTARSLESLKTPPHSSYHEQRAMTRDGWRWLGWSNTAVLDDHGHIAAITAVGRDITDIKKLESRFAHSQKMKAFGEMAGGITHDFNNLLQVIFGNVDFILKKAGQDEEVRERLERICQVVERAMTLTQKLSTLSRQEVTQKELFDLNEFSNELLELLRHTLPSSIDLSCVPHREPLRIEADKMLLEQVLLNLSFNARDALDSIGRIEISLEERQLDERFIGWESEMEPGAYALIAVRDSGRGIDPDVLPRIFDPFFTTKEKGTGSGLGLANCYSIIKQHKGLILVESTPGEGTCFSIYLPLFGSLQEPPQPADPGQ